MRRLAEVAERAIEVQRTGVPLTPEERFEVFGEVAFDLSYATEAELKWAHSEGQREAMARANAHTKEDWTRLMGEAAAWRGELLAAFDEEEPSCGGRAMDLAEEHRLHIARWFTSCPPDMHRRIADDFVADPRAFALVVPPSQQRPGLAAYLRKAVHANAARHTGDPIHSSWSSARTAVARRRTAGGFGNTWTTSVRRLISRFSRSSGFVLRAGRMPPGVPATPVPACPAASHEVGQQELQLPLLRHGHRAPRGSPRARVPGGLCRGAGEW
ncbi:hypothetical protein SUDANB21_05228 [Streptomyces sp. enrichment culture]